MRTRTYESTPPRLALAVAAFALAFTSLGALVLLPAMADDREATATFAARSADLPTTTARPRMPDARSATNDAHPAKRGT